MRGFLIYILLSMSLSIGYAQSLRLVNSSGKIFGRVGSEIEAPVAIKNVSLPPVVITIHITLNNISNGQESYFCIVRACFAPDTDISTESKILRTGEIFDGFRSVLRSGMGKRNTQMS